MWTGWVIWCIPWSRCNFQRKMQFSKMIVPPFIQLELFTHGLNCMKLKFNISCQHSHHIWTSSNHSGQRQRLEWGIDSTSRTTKAILLKTFQNFWYYSFWKIVLCLAEVIPINFKVWYHSWYHNILLEATLAKRKIWSLGKIMGNTLRHCKHVTEWTPRKGRQRTEETKEVHCPGYISMQAQSGL
jgi:hypothetical protein